MNQDQQLRSLAWKLIDELEKVRAQPAGESDWRALNQADVDLRRELEADKALTATQGAVERDGWQVARKLATLAQHAKDCLSHKILPTGVGNWHCTCGYGDLVLDGELLNDPADLLEASAQREQPAEHMKRWQIMPTVKVRSTNQELAVTGVYEEVVFVDLPEQPAASEPGPQGCGHCLGGKVDAGGTAHDCDYPNCVSVHPEPQAQAGEPEPVAEVYSTGPHNFPILRWKSADHSFRTEPGDQLITLQSHREAMAKLQAEKERTQEALDWSASEAEKYLDKIDAQNEAIAKKDAALKAYEEAAENARAVLSELYAKYQLKIGPFASQAQLSNVQLGAAISQGKGALE